MYLSKDEENAVFKFNLHESSLKRQLSNTICKHVLFIYFIYSLNFTVLGIENFHLV